MVKYIWKKPDSVSVRTALLAAPAASPVPRHLHGSKQNARRLEIKALQRVCSTPSSRLRPQSAGFGNRVARLSLLRIIGRRKMVGESWNCYFNIPNNLLKTIDLKCDSVAGFITICLLHVKKEK